MKIVLSNEEATNILFNYFSELHPNAEVEVIINSQSKEMREMIEKTIEVVEKHLAAPAESRFSHKIAAIKAIRDCWDCGLKEAKDAVENWDETKTKIRECNEWVVPTPSDSFDWDWRVCQMRTINPT